MLSYLLKEIKKKICWVVVPFLTISSLPLTIKPVISFSNFPIFYQYTYLTCLLIIRFFFMYMFPRSSGSKHNAAHICYLPEEVDIVINCDELSIHMRMTFLGGFAHNKKGKELSIHSPNRVINFF